MQGTAKAGPPHIGGKLNLDAICPIVRVTVMISEILRLGWFARKTGDTKCQGKRRGLSRLLFGFVFLVALTEAGCRQHLLR